MKKPSPFFIISIVVLVSLSCSTLNFNPASPDSTAVTPTHGDGATGPFRSKGQVITIVPSGPTPTPISSDAKSFSDAVGDDIAMILFVGFELKLSDLEPPSSPRFEICYEENIQSLTIDPDSVFVSHFFPSCEFSEVTDFAMSATVKLESDSPTASCGYLFRTSTPGTWYMLELERSAGSSKWSLVYVQNSLVQKVIRPPAADDNLDLSAGATTRVLLSARGKFIKVFFNTQLAGEAFDPSLPAGGIGIFSRAASGEATCRFDSLWVNIYH